MAYGEPTYGESGEVYTDKVRNSLAYVKSAAEAAQATADNAVASIVATSQTADEAKEIALAAQGYLETPTDGRMAEHINDTASATSAALSASYARRTTPEVGATAPFGDPTRVHPSATVIIIGIDTTAEHVFGSDTTNDNVKRADSFALDAWFNINLPTGATRAEIGPFVRWGGYVYVARNNIAADAMEVYRALPVTGSTAYTWTLVHTAGIGSRSWHTNLSGGTQYLYLAEYGDPTAGCKIYRTADGTTWETVYSHATARHWHAVIEDPYNAGHVYAAGGDGDGTSLVRSLDYGDTWTIVSSPASTQMVQLSFDEDWIYGAADGQQGTFLIWDRETLTPRLGSPNYHANHPVLPAAAATDRYYKNAYWGVVDPDTGIYYCAANDTSVAGNTQGLFYCPSVGREVALLYTNNSNLTGNAMLIAGGYLWTGQWRRPLLAGLI